MKAARTTVAVRCLPQELVPGVSARIFKIHDAAYYAAMELTVGLEPTAC